MTMSPDQVETSLRVQVVHQQIQDRSGRGKAATKQRKAPVNYDQEEDCNGDQ